MKKITALITMALCLVVVGVYATWNYAQGKIDPVPAYLDPTITNKVTTTDKGTMTVSQGITLSIDDTDNDHVAELIYGGSALTVTFTPAAGADQDVIDNGIDLQLVLSVTADWKYNGTSIFAVDTTPIKSPTTINGTDGVGTLTKSGNVITWTVTADQIKDKIGFYTEDYTTDGTLKLETAAKYDAFHTELHKGDIIFTISEVA